MADRSELMEAALEVYPEGLAVMDPEGRVVFWNRAAEAMTGFTRADVLGRPIPAALEPLTLSRDCEEHRESGRRSQVHVQHKSGHDVAAIADLMILRDGLGKRIGIAAVFHSGENLNSLPHRETSRDSEVRQSKAEFRERLENEYEMWILEVLPLAILWITVDQANQLRKTHGARACETMLENLQRTLANGLRPGEEIGRWGNDEFLVLSHESSPESMRSRGRVLGGLARTADSRWWGDRVSLTVSVGAAVCETGETLTALLERARAAMQDRVRTGGNHVTLAAAAMIAILGIILVFAAVLGGFVMENGHIAVLLQPAELLIIGGAATGTLLAANPLYILRGIAAGLRGVLEGSKFGKDRYLSTLRMMYQFLNKVRKDGLLSVEMDVEKPAESSIFKNYPDFLNDHHARDFVCDTLRMAITGGVEPFEMDQVMDLDMEVHHHEASQPVNALTTVADALPGLGIVAAVLGVVITMGALGGPPEEIGHKVAAALVGTFLGVLLCYGVAGPLSANMAKAADEHNGYLHVLRVLLLSFLKGSAPMIAIEMGRRAIPWRVRPGFDEMEKHCKRQAGAETAAAA